jgi:hypothetical protein
MLVPVDLDKILMETTPVGSMRLSYDTILNWVVCQEYNTVFIEEVRKKACGAVECFKANVPVLVNFTAVPDIRVLTMRSFMIYPSQVTFKCPLA